MCKARKNDKGTVRSDPNGSFYLTEKTSASKGSIVLRFPR